MPGDIAENSIAELTALQVSVRFILRGIWVLPEVLGKKFTWTVNKYRVNLTLPKQADDFYEEEPETPPVPAWVHTARMQDSGEAVAVHLIQVTVDFSGAVSAADKASSMHAQDAGNEAPLKELHRLVKSFWTAAHEIAVETTHAWLSHIRASSRQSWLGIVVERPAQYGRSHIIDRDADVRLMSFGPLKSATARSGGLALSQVDLTKIAQAVGEQGEPPAAEALLADARFLAREAEVVDSQRAVLIAAAACEIKTKLTIKDKTDQTKAALVDFVLRKISNLPDLLDGLIAGALGVTLRKCDPELFTQVKRLSSVRNQIIHGGIGVDQLEGYQLVVAAEQVFRWLDSL